MTLLLSVYWLARLVRRAALAQLVVAAAPIALSANAALADDRYALPSSEVAVVDSSNVKADPQNDVLILYQRDADDHGVASHGASPSTAGTSPAARLDAITSPHDVEQPLNPLRRAPVTPVAAAEPLIHYQAEAIQEPAVAPLAVDAKPLAAPSPAVPARLATNELVNRHDLSEPTTSEIENIAAAVETTSAAAKSTSSVSAPRADFSNPARRLAPPSRDWSPSFDSNGGASFGATSSRSRSLVDSLQGQAGSFKTTGVGLAIVIGLLLALAWLVKPTRKRNSDVLPSEAFEVLGRAPLVGQSVAHLLRLGNKLVLVSINPDGAQTLAEVTDPMEVGRLTGLCAGTKSNSPTAEFQKVLADLAREPARGFLGREASNRRRA